MPVDLEFAMNGARWTADECTYLCTHLRTRADAVDVGIALRRSAEAVIKKARSLGVFPHCAQRRLPLGLKERILEVYAELGAAPIAAEFGITRKRVANAAYHYGVRLRDGVRVSYSRDMAVVFHVAGMLRNRETTRRYSEWSYGNIGRRVGMTRSAIAGIARDLKDGRLAVAVSS